jgi:uncharacterized protein (DUF2147 family)
MMSVLNIARITMLSISIAALSAEVAIAANADDILGVWFNGEKDAQIELFTCGEKYCGRIVWLKEPNYPEGSKDGTPGTPKLDHNNPDPARKKAPIIGLPIVYGFTFAGDDLWKDGKVYDPKNGKTYKGKMTLVSPRQLNLRGYIGISLIGRTTTWTR